MTDQAAKPPPPVEQQIHFAGPVPPPADLEGLLAQAVGAAAGRISIVATTGAVRVAWASRGGGEHFKHAPRLEVALRAVLDQELARLKEAG